MKLVFLFLTFLHALVPEVRATEKFRHISLTHAHPQGNFQDFCYFALNVYGRRKEPREHAGDMAPAGYVGAKRLIEMHGHTVPLRTAVLDVGPYYNPLFPLFNLENHPAFAWEYDAPAGRALLKEYPRLSLFQADLRDFDARDWLLFGDLNRRHIDLNTNRKGFGAVILSSVLNYVDYKLALEHIVPMASEGGLLVVSNTAQGDGQYLQRSPSGIEIFEQLVQMFPSQLQVLPGSHVDRNYKSSQIQLAATISWEAETNASDIYKQGIGMLVDQMSAQVQPERWETVREALIQAELARRHVMLYEISVAGRGFALAEEHRENLSPVENFDFVPERAILLQALKMRSPAERKEYLERHLGAFYARMGHPMPNLNICPAPANRYPAEIDPLVKMYRQLSN